jgi:predicted ribosome quality control (RQC) complex YloA/Tae2 family protein
MRFASRHTIWLEKELEKQEQRHREEIARLQSTHAEQLKYAIEENERLRDELTRTRYLLTPQLRDVSLEPDNTPPPAPSDEGGTPWQRILKRAIKAQQDQDRESKRVATEAATKGENGDGSHS